MIRTSVKPETLTLEDTVRAYTDLSTVERAFRCLKTVDVKIRPIFHWLDDRIRAHVFLCMLAYYVEGTCARYSPPSYSKIMNERQWKLRVHQLCSPPRVPKPPEPKIRPSRRRTNSPFTASALHSPTWERS